MRIGSIIAAPVLAGACVGFAIAPAGAANNGPDNSNGQVERGPAHANSICSFSGQNDTPLDPVEGGRVQSFGQVVKGTKAGGGSVADLKAAGEYPGLLCNGHKFPYPEAFQPPAP